MLFGPRIEEDLVRWQASEMITEAIAAFWEGWSTLRPQIEAEIAAAEYGGGTERLTSLCEFIEPNLEWELMSGTSAQHALCLSAAADPRLRLITQRWVEAAPPADATWEYHPARIAVGLETITLADLVIDPTGATVGIEPDPLGEALDLTIGHPDFKGIEETLQLQAAFRFLDDLLGEDSVERWVGSIDVVPTAVAWGIGLGELASSVELLADAATGEQWERIEQRDAELGNSELTINRALKRLDYVEFTALITVSVEIPSLKDVALADTVEDDLAGILGKDGLIFARETYGTFVVIYAYGRGTKIAEVAKLPERHGPAVYDVVTESDAGWDAYDEMR